MRALLFTIISKTTMENIMQSIHSRTRQQFAKPEKLTPNDKQIGKRLHTSMIERIFTNSHSQIDRSLI